MAALPALRRASECRGQAASADSEATIITSQLPIEHWHAWIGDATIADAILDRIMQRNHRFILTGDSLRPEKQKPVKKEKTIELS